MTVGFAYGGGMNGPDYELLKFSKDKGCRLIIAPLPWTSDPKPILLSDATPPNARIVEVSKGVASQLWQALEAKNLRLRKQLDADYPPPDAAYCNFVVRWGNNADSAQTNRLIFRKDTSTFRDIEPLVLIMRKIADKQR